MARRPRIFAVTTTSTILVAVVSALSLTGSAIGATPVLVYERDIVPLFQKYCYECHGDGMHKAELALDEYKTAADVQRARKQFEAVLRQVGRHEMPPSDAAVFPTETEREAIAQFIERELYQLDPANPDPGRVRLRRLNRAEYNNAIRDLVGVDFAPAKDFPPDDSGYGFDNIGDVLSLPPILMEKYLAAADKVLDQAIVTEPLQTRIHRVPASLALIGFNAVGDRGDGWVQLISLEEDDVAVELPIAAPGDYLVRFQAFATKTGGALVGQGSEKPIEFKQDPGPTRIAFALNDAFVRDFVVTTDESRPEIYEARVGVAAGTQRFRATMRRKRYGENELVMLNGRLGVQQPGIVYVKWIEIEGPLATATRRFVPAQLRVTGDGRLLNDGARMLAAKGDVTAEINLPRDGEILLRAQAYAYQAGAEPVRMEFQVDGKPIKTFDVLAPGEMKPLPKQRPFSPTLLLPQPEIYEFRMRLPAGRHTFSAAFVNPFADPENENPNLRERRLVLQHLEVADLSSPAVVPVLPPPLAEMFQRWTAISERHLNAPGGRVPPQTEAARGIIGDFSRRAWRRPISEFELDRLTALYALARQQGDSFEGAVKLALKGVLASPHFLFIGELTNNAASSAASSGRLHTAPISELVLASRLSFFLWSSIPDDELLGLAEKGQLRKQLDAQVRRMLASSKARALVDNFAGQWLQIRSLETLRPDAKRFPAFDPALRGAMQRETELFFEHVMREDRSVFDFLRGEYTFVNGRLAKFYGLPDMRAEEFQKVSLTGTPRRGVLTQGSVLTLTSNPTRTSPVKRGKWVLDNLLGTPPPPPPPDVPQLDDKERKLTGTLRQQLEQHRANPACASCHTRMDAIGFALENFDSIGAWREQEDNVAIDPKGTLPGDQNFTGAVELAELLATQKPDEFRRCLAEKMLTYALGRGTEYYDRPAINRIIQQLRANEDRFSALILAVTQSFPFQHQRMP
jgi:hypothetical protein